MKTTFKINFIILLLLLDVGCKKSNPSSSLLEINPNSEMTVIQTETNNIGFEFCLLNDKGQASTVFNEGENLTFSFTFKNKLQDSIIVTTEFINYEFFRVFLSENNVDMGKPWTGTWCDFNLLPHEIRLKPSSLKQITCPWILTDNNRPVYPLCMSVSKNLLLKGEYYTYINLDFHYSLDGKVSVINNLIFKINFRII